jgi:serine/threonine protein kinase
MSLDPRIPQILSRWQTAESKPSAEELCATCPELLPQVRQMIGALHSVHAPTMEGPGDGSDGSSATVTDHGQAHRRHLSDPSGLEFPVAAAAEVPSHIGPYRIIAALGAGGMGVVYKAEQRHPMKRLVALKLIKLGMDTRHVIARFESERQALAVMDHPNIAKVIDAGATESGRPYFVMEFVPGEPINDYCDKNRLTTEQRLNLFAQVCDALQHAHQKGIIHRDLKPSNILVEYRDNRAVPKVIDFGIAKATSAGGLTEKTLYTETGQLVGTPEYASPEQAETSGMDVDTRTDIYSLGVILYELLTGKLPFDPKTLRSAGYAQMQRIIREEDPPKPSARLTKITDAQELESIAKRRRTEPRVLSKRIRGELDWIILKAMDKDRQRRYETAAALAQDIGRYLRDEAVNAGPPTATYRVGKFVKRHFIGIAASGAVAAALLIGLAMAVVGFYQARHQRDVAVKATDQALVAKSAADGEARRTREMVEFLQKALAATDPQQAKLMNVSLEEVLARSRQLFGDDHAIIGNVLTSRASSLRAAGQFAEAERALIEALNAYRRAYGSDHGTVAAALTSLGIVQSDRGDQAAAEDSLRQSVAMRKRLFGERSLPVAESLDELFTVVNKRVGIGEVDKNELKKIGMESVDAYRAALGDRDRRAMEERCKLGIWLAQNGFPVEAEPVLASVVSDGPAVLGKDSQLLFNAMNSLTALYVQQNKTEQARTTFIDLNNRVADVFGSRSPIVLASALQLGKYLLERDDLSTAETVMRSAIETAGTAVPRGDPVLTDMKGRLIDVSLQRKNFDKKWLRDFWLEYLEDRRIQYGANSERMISFTLPAAERLLEWGYAQDAEVLYRALLPIQRAAAPPQQEKISDTLLGLGTAMLAMNSTAQAEDVLREALEIRKRIFREGDWQIADAQARLGECLLALGRPREAEPLLDDASKSLDSARLAPPAAKHRALANLMKLYAATGKPNEAEEVRQKMTATSQPTTSNVE